MCSFGVSSYTVTEVGFIDVFEINSPFIVMHNKYNYYKCNSKCNGMLSFNSFLRYVLSRRSETFF